jgi:DNA-binding winged helix-turn-helix (wHTH) protein
MMPDARGSFGGDQTAARPLKEPISIGPQVFELLVYLVQNRERVFSNNLLDAIWSGRNVRRLSFDCSQSLD